MELKVGQQVRVRYDLNRDTKYPDSQQKRECTGLTDHMLNIAGQIVTINSINNIGSILINENGDYWTDTMFEPIIKWEL